MRSEDILELVRRTPFMWPDSIIHVFPSGSAMHGATGNKPSDTDISGVYIPPVELMLGITQKNENGKWFDPDTQVWSSAGDKANTADDIDVNLYSLRKWATMAATGHPTALEFLFVHNEAPDPYCTWEYILPYTHHFLSKKAGTQAKGFAEAMLLRINGGNTGRHGQRPELEAEFGYDVKGAMHMLRVLNEGIELMTTGRITLPRPEPELTYLKDVRSGKFTRDEVIQNAEGKFNILALEQSRSSLPDEVDRMKISEIITNVQLEFWGLG